MDASTSTQDYRAEAETILNRAIQMVIFHYNAFAPILSAFTVAYTDIIPTMGVDKYARLVVNPKFLVENQAHAEGLLIHEILHVFMGHTTDVRSKLAYTDDIVENRLINLAEDCAINQFIDKPLPNGAVTPYTLERIAETRDVKHNETAEYYYDIIKNAIKNDNDNNDCTTAITGAADEQDSTGDVNTQAVQDKLEQMGVKHVSAGEISDRRLDCAKEIEQRGQGSGYGHLADFARQLLEPKVDWRPLLQATLRNAEKKVWNIHTKSTYKRTSRRSQAILLPKKYGHKIAVTLSFDTSGSISAEMVNQFLSEVQSCMRLSEIKECALWHTDNYWYGTPEQLMKNVEDVFESGGTESKCVENCAEHCKADIGFTFTDGCWGKDPQRQPSCQTRTMYAIIWGGTDIKEIRRLW